MDIRPNPNPRVQGEGQEVMNEPCRLAGGAKIDVDELFKPEPLQSGQNDTQPVRMTTERDFMMRDQPNGTRGVYQPCGQGFGGLLPRG